MKKLLFTTTIVGLGAISSFAGAGTISPQSLSSAEFSVVMNVVSTTSAAVNLHTGDFTCLTKQANGHLYQGAGSSLMTMCNLQR